MLRLRGKDGIGAPAATNGRSTRVAVAAPRTRGDIGRMERQSRLRTRPAKDTVVVVTVKTTKKKEMAEGTGAAADIKTRAAGTSQGTEKRDICFVNGAL